MPCQVQFVLWTRGMPVPDDCAFLPFQWAAGVLARCHAGGDDFEAGALGRQDRQEVPGSFRNDAQHGCQVDCLVPGGVPLQRHLASHPGLVNPEIGNSNLPADFVSHTIAHCPSPEEGLITCLRLLCLS
jgi:hypothetical protein